MKDSIAASLLFQTLCNLGLPQFLSIFATSKTCCNFPLLLIIPPESLRQQFLERGVEGDEPVPLGIRLQLVLRGRRRHLSHRRVQLDDFLLSYRACISLSLSLTSVTDSCFTTNEPEITIAIVCLCCHVNAHY